MNCTECGGAVALQTAEEQDPENWHEEYECVECGAHGTMRMEGGKERRLGCLAN